MKEVSVILLMAGNSSRMNVEVNKVYLPLGNKKVFNHSLDKFLKISSINKIIIVYNQNDLNLLKKELENYEGYNIFLTEGGKTRNESVLNGLKLVDTEFVLIHDAARPFTSLDDINSLINSLNDYDVVTLYHDVVDAIKMDGISIDKNKLKAVTTPQGFNKKAYNYLLNNPNSVAQDDLEIIENTNYSIGYLKETTNNKKITFKEDLQSLEYKVGYSMDFHPFIEKDYLLLGGVKIPFNLGLKGHSDADCVYHALTEAILGSLHLGDMGYNYPDNDPKYKDYDSSKFLLDVKEKLKEHHYVIVNIDIMIYLEKPKLVNYKKQMEENISKLLEIPSDLVSIKATTFEKKGPIGSSEGVCSEAFVLIKKVY